MDSLGCPFFSAAEDYPEISLLEGQRFGRLGRQSSGMPCIKATCHALYGSEAQFLECLSGQSGATARFAVEQNLTAAISERWFLTHTKFQNAAWDVDG